MKMSRLLFALSGFLLLFSLLFYFKNPDYRVFQKLSSSNDPPQPAALPVTKAESLNRALNGSVQDKYDRELASIESDFKQGRISIEEAARRRAIADIEASHSREQIAGKIHNCPENSRWLDNAHTRLVMDITECRPGRSDFWLDIPDSEKPERYELTLFKYGTGQAQKNLEQEVGKQLVPIAEKAVLKKCSEMDTFAVCNAIALDTRPGVSEFDLRGRVCFYPQGNADFLYMEKLAQ